jgi:purine-binding chemotaxis protein CheW
VENLQAASPASPRRAVPAPREYLTFRVGAQEYAIDIMDVQEIRGYEQPTRVASAPAFVKGVVKLRGTSVPVVDLRLRFGLAEAAYDRSTVVIMLNLGGRVIGVVADSASDVIELPPDAVRDAPDTSAAIDPGCVLGVARVGERMLTLLDIERLLGAPGMVVAGGTSPASSSKGGMR